jgi:hypothetical protein
MDVVSASVIDDKVAWHQNLGGGVFGSEHIISSQALGARCVFVADLDGNGAPDVLSASLEDDKIAWYPNLGGGTFGDERLLTLAADGAARVHAADLDSDGDPDVLFASREDDKVGWFENLGGGDFSPQRVISTNADGPLGLSAADLNGDGYMDVLSASRHDDEIAWYPNLGPCGGTTYCVTSPNTSGPGAHIFSSGEAAIAANTFTLEAIGAVPSQVAIFYYGTEATSAPFGEGVRCVGGLTTRLLPPLFIDGAGTAERHVDFTSPPASVGTGHITSGSTWHFQFWYRDPGGGPVGFNFSDALEVTFCP